MIKPKTGFSIAAACVLLMMLAGVLVLGSINQDEGWYLYAARMVAQGQLPYADFAFTQAPLLPIVYSWFQPLFAAQGVAAGRAVTALFGVGAALLFSLSASRLAAHKNRYVVFWAVMILTLINTYHAYYFTVVKTYALCSFFIALGCWLLSHLNEAPLKSRWAALAAAAFVLASAVRVSAGVLLPVTAFWLLFTRQRTGRRSWFWFGLSGVIAAVMVFGFFWWKAPDAFWFWNMEYHSGREAGGLVNILIYKVGFISRWVRAYLVLFALLAGGLVLKSARPPSTGSSSWVSLLMLQAGAVTLLHFSAPFPYDDYQVFIMPAAAAAVALLVFDRGAVCGTGADVLSPMSLKPLWLLLIVSVLAAGAAPELQEWMLRGRDRIWWLTKSEPDLLQLRRVAREIEQANPEAIDAILTQDTYLAIELNADVPRGLELGPFSYYPSLSTDKARTLHVVNDELLSEILNRAEPEVAAVSGYAFAARAPEVSPISDEERLQWIDRLKQNYEPVISFDYFGQASTVLEVYRKVDRE